MEQAQGIGMIVRELAETKRAVQDLRDEIRDSRRKLDSVPELVEDVAFTAGRKAAVRAVDSMRVREERDELKKTVTKTKGLVFKVWVSVLLMLAGALVKHLAAVISGK
jgi:hypothetical protein